MHEYGYRVHKSTGEYDPTGLAELGRNPSDFDAETMANIARFVNRAKQGSVGPSSARKKRVNEGNPKFIGPRTFQSELLEDYAAKSPSDPPLFPEQLRALVARHKESKALRDQIRERNDRSIGSQKLKYLIEKMKDRARAIEDGYWEEQY
jgi:hypothetical protein